MQKFNVRGEAKRILNIVGERAANRQLQAAAKDIVEDVLCVVMYGKVENTAEAKITFYDYLIKQTARLLQNKSKSIVMTDPKDLARINNLLANVGVARVNRALKDLKKEKQKDQIDLLHHELCEGTNLLELQEILKDFRTHQARSALGEIKFNNVKSLVRQEIMSKLLENFSTETVIARIEKIQDARIKMQFEALIETYDKSLGNNDPKCFSAFEKQYNAARGKNIQEK